MKMITGFVLSALICQFLKLKIAVSSTSSKTYGSMAIRQLVYLRFHVSRLSTKLLFQAVQWKPGGRIRKAEPLSGESVKSYNRQTCEPGEDYALSAHDG
jgi:hypothetical protein